MSITYNHKRNVTIWLEISYGHPVFVEDENGEMVTCSFKPHYANPTINGNKTLTTTCDILSHCERNGKEYIQIYEAEGGDPVWVVAQEVYDIIPAEVVKWHILQQVKAKLDGNSRKPSSTPIPTSVLDITRPLHFKPNIMY